MSVSSNHERNFSSHPSCGAAMVTVILWSLQYKRLSGIFSWSTLIYLIHFPASIKPGKHVVLFDKEDILPMDFKSVWEAMEECQRLGLAKSIGVSNFSCKKLADLLAVATIPPAVNQVALRWAYEQGVSVLVKSFNKDRMKENLKIWDWALSDEEKETIHQIPQCKGLSGNEFVWVNGPYKSTVDLWDGEI
eukprot:TRINITY_DN4294_c0_g1_i2.p1 TRINITY_DN4294_c0_g1~~TRINITY_DN4294_c0_g1_i2.p1  ORF type:complete len:191 (-),score=25.49 TRINITY_DN4294_c0_g1_i2:220-792(-)